MDDLISRQAAIDAIRASTLKFTGFMEMEMYTDDDAVEAIEDLPSAQPERKKGKWKETDDGWDGTYYVCSECGCPWTLIDGTPEDNDMNFCPNCGARMVDDDIS